MSAGRRAASRLRGAAECGIRAPNRTRRTTIPSALIADRELYGLRIKGKSGRGQIFAKPDTTQGRQGRKGVNGTRAARAFAEPQITHFLDISAKNDDSWGEAPPERRFLGQLGTQRLPQLECASISAGQKSVANRELGARRPSAPTNVKNDFDIQKMRYSGHGATQQGITRTSASTQTLP